MACPTGQQIKGVKNMKKQRNGVLSPEVRLMLLEEQRQVEETMSKIRPLLKFKSDSEIEKTIKECFVRVYETAYRQGLQKIEFPRFDDMIAKPNFERIKKLLGGE